MVPPSGRFRDDRNIHRRTSPGRRRQTAPAVIALLLLSPAQVPAAHAGNDHLYVVDSAAVEVRRFAPDGEVSSVVLRTEFVVGPGLAFDADDGVIFWTDDTLRQVVRLDLATDALTRIGCHDLAQPAGLGVDPQHDVLYVIDDAIPAITKISYDDATHTDIVLGSPDAPMIDIAPHPAMNELYWSVTGVGLHRSDLDGDDAVLIAQDDLTDPRYLALDAANDALYVTESHRVVRVDLATGAVAELIAFDSSQTIVGGLALDVNAGRLYWHLDREDGTSELMSYTIDTSFLAPIAIGVAPADIVVAGPGVILWADGVRLRETTDGLTTDRYVSTLVNPSAITIDDTRQMVYWANGKTIRRADLEGRDEEVFASLNLTPRAMAVDERGGRLLWVEGPANIYTRSLDGGPITSLPTNDLVSVNDIATHGAFAYAVDSGTDRIVRIALSNGAVTSLFEYGNLATPVAITIDAVHNDVLWADPIRDEIWTMGLDGSDPSILLTDPDGPYDVAVSDDGELLYWMTIDPPAIRRVATDGSALDIFPLPDGIVPQTILVGPITDGSRLTDVTNNGSVNIDDLFLVINTFGPCPCEGACDADVNDSSAVNVDDLTLVLQDFDLN